MTKIARQYTPPAIKDHRGIYPGKLVDSSGEQWSAAREAESPQNQFSADSAFESSSTLSACTSRYWCLPGRPLRG